MHGYSGRMLHVHLSTGQTAIETFDETFAKAYLGGNGFAIRLLYDRLASGIDPLAPENIVVLAIGPATDTLIPGATRCCAATKSPSWKAFSSEIISLGTILPTTEMTPSPPIDNRGNVILSSPLRTVRFVAPSTWDAWSIEPVASLTIVILSSSARRAIVSGSMFFPVRPGML